MMLTFVLTTPHEQQSCDTFFSLSLFNEQNDAIDDIDMSCQLTLSRHM